MIAVDQIIAYEQGDLSASDTLEMFSKLVLSGEAWQLQGHYGRTAASLIERGYLDGEGYITPFGIAVIQDESRPRPGDQCDETCTVDCGHCKGIHA